MDILYGIVAALFTAGKINFWGILRIINAIISVKILLTYFCAFKLYLTDLWFIPTPKI